MDLEMDDLYEGLETDDEILAGVLYMDNLCDMNLQLTELPRALDNLVLDMEEAKESGDEGMLEALGDLFLSTGEGIGA